MSLIKGQNQASVHRGLPVEEKGSSSVVTAISGETASFFYDSSGTRTADAGQAAGTAVEVVFARTNIRSSNGKMGATKNDTSLSFTSTAFTTEVSMVDQGVLESLDDASFSDRLAALTAGLANGEYRIDHVKGIGYGKKASTQTSLTSVAYSVSSDTATATISGVATEAKQDTIITAVGSTNTLLTGIDVDTDAIKTATQATQAATEAVFGPATPTIDSYTSAKIDLAAATANQVIVAAPGASKQIWVYGLAVTVDADGSLSFQDEDDLAITGVMPVAANGGFAFSPSGNFAMPTWKLATNKALECDTLVCTGDGYISYAIVSV